MFILEESRLREAIFLPRPHTGKRHQTPVGSVIPRPAEPLASPHTVGGCPLGVSYRAARAAWPPKGTPCALRCATRPCPSPCGAEDGSGCFSEALQGKWPDEFSTAALRNDHKMAQINTHVLSHSFWSSKAQHESPWAKMEALFLLEALREKPPPLHWL